MTTRRRTHVGRVLAMLASALLLLALAECGLRLSGLAPVPARELPADHPLKARLKPNVCETAGSSTAAYLVQMCSNALGLRDHDHAEGESPRVLGVGDAATSGWGVEPADSFLAHLERALRLALPSSRPGVFNAGLGNTSQAHQDALLRYLFGKVRPDVVVLAFAEADDVDENIFWNPNLGAFPDLGELSPAALVAYRDELRSAGARENFTSKHSAVVRFVQELGVRVSAGAEVRLLGKRLEAYGLKDAPLSRRVADEAGRRFRSIFGDRYEDDWALTEVLLERMRKFVEGRGARLVLLRIPSRASIDDASFSSARNLFCGSDPALSEKRCGALARDRTARRLANYATTHELIYVDPGEELARAMARGESVYLSDENYLSRLGHARVGESLSRALLPALGAKLEERPVEAAPSMKRKERLVGAYWYPWYRSRDWAWFTDYTPQGGAYQSSDPGAIENQLRWAERADVDFLIIELLADQNADSKLNARAIDALLGTIVERRARGYSRMRFAMMSDISKKETDVKTDERWREVTRDHLDQIWSRYVEEYGDAYVRVDGKPLVAIFSPPVSIDDSRFTVVRPYWVSHEQWKTWSRKNELLPFWDTYPQTVTDRRFMSVVPGYNDWRLERRPQVAPYLPRLGGHTFVEQWRRVFEVDPEVVLIYSFNEYFEQTQIEPTRELGDRYLLLNQLLARRFKDGRPLDVSAMERLPGVLEPPVTTNEKVMWLPIDDPRLTSRGLQRVSSGRAAFREQAEIDLEIRGDNSVVIGLTYEPSFEPCAWLSVRLPDENPPKIAYFKTELTQLAVLRDLSIPASTKRIRLALRREADSKCRDGGTRPVILTGVASYPVSTKERQNFQVWQDDVKLEGFWDIERHSSGHPFSWSRGKSTVTISQLTPGTRYQVTLTFIDKAKFDEVAVGPDPEHLQRVAITQGLTATVPKPITVSSAGRLAVSMRTPTWRPSVLFGAKDQRALGLALRLITLDRTDGASDQ